MRTLAIVFCLMGAARACFGAGVVEGNGIADTREENIRSFTEIDIGSGIALEVVQGDLFAVSIRADSNVLPHIRVEKRGPELRIFAEPGINLRTRGMLARVIMPRLEKLSAHGGSQVSLAFDMPRGRIEGSISGGGGIRGTLAADEVRLDATGGATVTLEGYCADLDLHGSGGSRFLLSAFRARAAAVELSGGSRAELDVTDALELRLSGGSNVVYRGSPKIDARQMTGGSEVQSAP